jgi:hypothetical protein
MYNLYYIYSSILMISFLFSCSSDPDLDVWVVNADVYGIDENDVYVAGYNSGCGCKKRGFVKHSDGRDWTTIFETEQFDLWSVWSASSEVFAAYDGGILHFKNDKWDEIAFDAESELALFDISGSSVDNVIAVGRDGTILHYDGEHLVRMESDTTEQLEGVWVGSATDAYAVGKSGTILHYDGDKWLKMDSGTPMELNEVWGSSPDDVYAVGGSETERGYVIVHYDGAEWKTIGRGEPYHLLGLSGSSATNIYAVGAARQGDSIEGFVLHFDGKTWKRVKTSINEFIWSVWSSPSGDYFLVGPDDTIVHKRP